MALTKLKIDWAKLTRARGNLTLAAAFYSEDQPRDENGRWAGGANDNGGKPHKTAETGKPIKIKYLKNPEKAPNLGSTYGQDVEPAGFYVSQHEGYTPPGWKTGEVVLENPLVIDVDKEGLVEYKRNLSEKYGGKTGKALSRAMQKDGWDGIITQDKYGLGEIIVFSHQDSFFDPDQPRGEDGKWTDGGGGSGGQAPSSRADYKKIVTSDPDQANQLMAEYKNQATDKELKTVVEYTQTHFAKINGHLRSMDKYPDQPLGAYGLQRIEEIKQMDNFLADAPKFQGETYRRMALDQFDYNKMAGMMQPGAVFDHPAYMSTTTDREYLDRYKMVNDDQYVKDKQYVVDFKVRGKTGVAIEKISSRPTEKEVLIPRGSRFKVVSANEIKDGARRRLELEVEQLDSAPGKFYDDSQPRDENGRWTDGGGGDRGQFLFLELDEI